MSLSNGTYFTSLVLHNLVGTGCDFLLFLDVTTKFNVLAIGSS